MCPVSQVPCHMSHVTCHLPPVTCHLPPVTNANSHIPSPADSPIIQSRLVPDLEFLEPYIPTLFYKERQKTWYFCDRSTDKQTHRRTWPSWWKSRVQETLNLSTCAESKTDTRKKSGVRRRVSGVWCHVSPPGNSPTMHSRILLLILT